MKQSLTQLLALAEPLAHTMGLEILLAEETKVRNGKGYRIYLDKPEGPTIDDCAKFSRALNPILDIEAGWEGQYNLEVSSPGLDRPLVKPKHFQAQLAKVIQVKTWQEVEGSHNFKGELLKVDEHGITIKVDNHEFEIDWEQIKKAHLDYFASEEKERKDSGVLPFKPKA